MSKPKEYRVCAFCGIKQHKSYMLKISLPEIIFDFWQNMHGRSFYICSEYKCINKVFKNKTVYKYIDESINTSLLYNRLIESIKNNTLYHINELFDKYGIDDDTNTEKLILCRYDAVSSNSKKILLDKAVYSGNKKFCIIYDKYTADKVIKYKNLITNIDGLLYGELNGIKKS